MHDFKNLNQHDPHNKLRWADEPKLSWWVLGLKIVGFVAGSIGATLCFYYLTVILFLMG